MLKRYLLIISVTAVAPFALSFKPDSGCNKPAFTTEKQSTSSPRVLTPADQKRLLALPTNYKVKLYLIMSKKESSKYGNSIAEFMRDKDYNVEVWPEDTIKAPAHALSKDEQRFEIKIDKTAHEITINVR